MNKQWVMFWKSPERVNRLHHQNELGLKFDLRTSLKVMRLKIPYAPISSVYFGSTSSANPSCYMRSMIGMHWKLVFERTYHCTILYCVPCVLTYPWTEKMCLICLKIDKDTLRFNLLKQYALRWAECRIRLK